jgi:hypothetical protein
MKRHNKALRKTRAKSPLIFKAGNPGMRTSAFCMMKTIHKARHWWLIVGVACALLVASIGSWCLMVSRSSPLARPISLEERGYNFLHAPPSSTAIDKLKYRLKWSGQAKIFDMAASAPKPTSMQEIIEKCGYSFPPGTYVRSGRCTDPGLHIRHYPGTLDRLEREFQLERDH